MAELPFSAEEFALKNARRSDLMDKRNLGGGLTPQELAEYRALRKECHAWLSAKYPAVRKSEGKLGGEDDQ